MNSNELPEVSSKCPICGVDTPHQHDAVIVKDHRENELHRGRLKMEEHQKLMARRQEVDAKILSELQRQVDVAVAGKARYEAACPCCRIARVGDELIKKTIGTLVVFDYGWRVEGPGDHVYCPECNAFLWDGYRD